MNWILCERNPGVSEKSYNKGATCQTVNWYFKTGLPDFLAGMLPIRPERSDYPVKTLPW